MASFLIASLYTPPYLPRSPPRNFERAQDFKLCFLYSQNRKISEWKFSRASSRCFNYVIKSAKIIRITLFDEGKKLLRIVPFSKPRNDLIFIFFKYFSSFRCAQRHFLPRISLRRFILLLIISEQKNSN